MSSACGWHRSAAALATAADVAPHVAAFLREEGFASTLHAFEAEAGSLLQQPAPLGLARSGGGARGAGGGAPCACSGTSLAPAPALRSLREIVGLWMASEVTAQVAGAGAAVESTLSNLSASPVGPEAATDPPPHPRMSHPPPPLTRTLTHSYACVQILRVWHAGAPPRLYGNPAAAWCGSRTNSPRRRGGGPAACAFLPNCRPRPHPRRRRRRRCQRRAGGCRERRASRAPALAQEQAPAAPGSRAARRPPLPRPLPCGAALPGRRRSTVGPGLLDGAALRRCRSGTPVRSH